MALALLLGVVSLRPLVVFRAPSRHTYGFDAPYDLPRLELCENDVSGALRLKPAGPTGFYWADGLQLAVLRQLARRAILVHSIIGVSASAATLELAVARGQEPLPGAAISVEIAISEIAQAACAV